MKLSKRAQEVLSSVIQEYILRGAPVGSGTLVRDYGLNTSAATVRHVMASLEDRGLLFQPHTSAGRVPTERGLRMYIDRLMRVREFTVDEKQRIMARYQLDNLEVQELLREVSRILSELSRHCALVLVPRSESSVLRRIEFYPLRQGRMIAVLLMDTGMVQNRMLEVERTLDLHDLEGVHRYLNELCDGKELSEVRRLVQTELEREQNRYDELVSQALHLGAQALAEPVEDEVLIEGRARLLDASHGLDPEDLKDVLRAVEEKRLVLSLLDETIKGKGVQVYIGAETGTHQMRNWSLVAKAYGGEQPLGTLGVIGPMRMDYPTVLPLVDLTAEILTRHLDNS